MKFRSTIRLIAVAGLIGVGLYEQGDRTQNPSKQDQASIKPSPEQPAAPLETRILEQVADRSTKIKKLQEFQEQLDQIAEEYKNKNEFTSHTKDPTRKLIKDKSGTQLVELTYEDGSKTYLPNFPRFDVSTGKFLPKEF